MSLLLEALKRAERAKKLQNIDEITAALENTPSTGGPAHSASPAASEPAPVDMSPLPASVLQSTSTEQVAAIAELPALDLPQLDFAPATASAPLSATPVSAETADSGNTLEFKLEPFDLPPLSVTPAPVASETAPLPNLDWATVELSPAPQAAQQEVTPEELSIPDLPDITAPEDLASMEAPADLVASAPLIAPAPPETTANEPQKVQSPAPNPVETIAIPAPVAPALPAPEAASPQDHIPEPMATKPAQAPRETAQPVPPPAASSTAAEAPSIAPQSTMQTASKLEEARDKARRLLGRPAPARPDSTDKAAKISLSARQKRLLALGAISTLVGAGVGLYVWDALNPTSLSPTLPPPVDTSQNTVAPTANDAGSTQAVASAPLPGNAPPPPPVDSKATDSPAPTTATTATPATASASTPSIPQTTTAPTATATPPLAMAPQAPAAPTTKSGKTTSDTSPALLSPAAQQPLPGTGNFSITRNPPRLEVLDDAVKQGYQAYEQGNFGAARTAYQRALRSDSRNRQAMLGMAAIEEASGNTQAAVSLYAQTLALDPKDSVAQAALVNLTSGNPLQAESKLRLLLAEQPNIPFLHFTLGNVLAAQQRWPDAEGAYFQAFTLDGSNPDFAFNLAISLDQLHQAKPAREYYQRALELSERRPYRFSRQVVRQRLEQLAAQ